MTLRIIRPAWADDDLVAVAGKLVSSNVVETVPVWRADGVYAVGDRVRRDETHRVYQNAVAGANSTVPENALTGTPARWLEVGATNRFSMFDAVNNTVTSNAGTIDVTLTPGRFNALYVGGLNAASVDITVTAGGKVVYTRHVRLLADNVFSWSQWTYEPIIRDTDLVLFDIPFYRNASIRVVINQPGGPASCATLVAGQFREIGKVQWRPTFRVKSNSVFKDKGFGNVALTKRPAARRVSCSVFIENALFDETNRLMAEYDGINLLWSMSGDLYGSLNVFGYKEDFDNTLDSPAGSFFNLQVLGLI